MDEIWKPIPNYEGIYEVSNLGNVKRILVRRGTGGGCLMPYMCPQGYLHVLLRNLGNDVPYVIHRLVATVFIDNPENKPFVNHLDGIRYNNIESNLEWATESENIQHSHDNLDRIFTAYGENHKNSRSVGQYDVNGNLINVFGSANEAGRQTGIQFTNICKVCRSERKYAGGYVWKYVDLPVTKPSLTIHNPRPKWKFYYKSASYYNEEIFIYK